MKTPSQSPVPAKRILVRGVNWLGDAVMTTPALMRLRETYPASHITLLTPAKLKDIYESHPAVDTVETFEPGEGVWSIGKRLRKRGFDLAIVFPNSPRSAIEVWLSGAPIRLGYARPNWRGLWLNRTANPPAGAVPMVKRSEAAIKHLIATGATRKPIPTDSHQMFHYLNLLGEIGCEMAPVAPHLKVAINRVESFESKFAARPVSGEPVTWLGLNPGAEYGAAKRWPEERFIAAAIEIRRRTRCRWLVFGIKADAELAQRITNAINQADSPASVSHDGKALPAANNLAGLTSLAELCAGLKLCRVVLTNDSGPMHVAAAVGTPVVVPFGSTSPELTGPGLPNFKGHPESNPSQKILRANAACSPCFLRECPVDFRCMKDIRVAEAVEAVCGFLK